MTAVRQAAGGPGLPAGDRAVRAVTPVPMGLDGQHGTFFIAQPDEQSFYLTDAGTAAMHAAAYGIELNAKRLELLNQAPGIGRSEEHTSELQSLMRISYAVFCLQKKKTN